jgi:hypothetical protein
MKIIYQYDGSTDLILDDGKCICTLYDNFPYIAIYGSQQETADIIVGYAKEVFYKYSITQKSNSQSIYSQLFRFDYWDGALVNVSLDGMSLFFFDPTKQQPQLQWLINLINQHEDIMRMQQLKALW